MVTCNLEQSKLAKLRWRCRRGMLELDLLLNNFVEHARGYNCLTPQQQAEFKHLLAYNDQQLYNWLIKKQQLGRKERVGHKELATILELILACNNTNYQPP